jgi:hypothetical protein
MHWWIGCRELKKLLRFPVDSGGSEAGLENVGYLGHFIPALKKKL